MARGEVLDRESQGEPTPTRARDEQASIAWTEQGQQQMSWSLKHSEHSKVRVNEAENGSGK